MSSSSPEPVTGPSAHLPSSTTASSSPRLLPPPAQRPLATEVFPHVTTHWTKPQSCTWTYVADSQSRPASQGAVAWLDLQPIPGASTLSCYPDGMFSGGRTGVFSPATCPSGWTTVSLRINTEKDLAEPVTTTAVCCSSYYTLDGSYCKRSVPTVLAVPITYNHTAGTYEVMSSSTTTLYSATIAVNTIRALFMEQDMSLLGLTDDEEISEDEVHGNPLPLGARIGAAIGVAIFSLLSIGAVIFCLLRWRRSRRRQAKGLRSHELGSVYGRRLRTHDSLAVREGHAAEPPPAYEASGPTNGFRGRGADNARQDEIRSLVAQKEAIQLRIEELERIGTDAEAISR
ncbi:hypothetical protein HRG_005852 [Hirsutella rhossiliensis]|uniref:Uncharacterized protein n=1 Tax=Hirsutella rhossiliensis TaxID=111463 RepID=A0A9P8N259_9HYPO|nr:uncharacterized protein HRG_05852 [Hirsutella rhossiliensis]KAH0963342.1 hypothetical protein HRG_05852 [Hirsutella rhossiliensis]